jgi:sporadic carbohydrate cluster 2OG-Fe(II) oxygenase
MSGKNLFLTNKENEISSKYLDQGYVVEPAASLSALSWIRKNFIFIIRQELNISDDFSDSDVLNFIHERVSIPALNDFRLLIIKRINSLPNFREEYYQVAKPYLDAIVGSELSMQLKVNLSIQLPEDGSSLLPIHADTWSGDSPFEVVVWIPLVDCYKTKAMYILPPVKYQMLSDNFRKMAGSSSEDLYKSVQEDVEQIKIKYGEVLIFNQTLPHGNRINIESETRWSMNCRFKGVFTPYGDKKLGEFFEPITLKPASKCGMNYSLPDAGD